LESRAWLVICPRAERPESIRWKRLGMNKGISDFKFKIPD
jgi:hypothetical protein